MSRKKNKFYVVWQGVNPGIYDTWEECLQQVKGVKDAKYKSFDTIEMAKAALQCPYDEDKCYPNTKKNMVTTDENGMTIVRAVTAPPPLLDAVAVDAACSGNPGVMEYQGVYVATRTRLFHYKAPVGTNNIGEFLGIVHGLSYLKRNNLQQVLYSDSVNAIKWVRLKECRSKLPLSPQTQELWDYIHRAEAWLHNNTYTTEIRKWDTDNWGEIPADFGRK